jgi:hypothetical protein
MKACPLHADFYKKLAADPECGDPVSQEKLNEELDKWLDALSVILTRVEEFYAKGDYAKLFLLPIHPNFHQHACSRMQIGPLIKRTIKASPDTVSFSWTL